jgi:hypothetical protein
MLSRFPVIALCLAVWPQTVWADKIKNPTAVFSGLDKITGRIISFDVAVNETVQFGALQLTPRICYSRPPTESPNTTGFVEVDEVGLDSKYKRLFSGWMFAASPGLHGIEHPIYDVWLVECKGGTEIIPEIKEITDEPLLPNTPDRPRTAPRQERRQDSAPSQDTAPRQQAPRQEPTRRFFPNNNQPGTAPDPAGR